LDIEELSRLKNALYDNVLEDPQIMRDKMLEMEAEKRKVVNLVERLSDVSLERSGLQGLRRFYE